MNQTIISNPLKDFSQVSIDSRKKLNISAGDTVKVWLTIKEINAKGKERVRLQAFEGLVLARKHGNEPGATITVRKVTKGVGVERIFPIFSPVIDKIEIIKKGKVRRSKLYHIREKVSREIRRQMRKAMLVNTTSLSEIQKKQDEEEKEKAEALKKEQEAKAKEAVAAEEKKTEENSTENTEDKKEDNVVVEKKD